MQKDEAEKLLRLLSFHIMGKDEIDAFGTLAGNAFPEDYPLFMHLFGKKDRKKIVATTVFNFRLSADGGLCYSFGDASMGNVIVLPPDYRAPGLPGMLAKGGFRLLFRIGLGAASRMKRYDEFRLRLKEKYDDGNMWYFESLTIPEEHQGKGLAAELVAPLILYLDSINASIYFETHSAENVEIYQHYGFELAERCKLPGSDIDHYVMIRRALNEGAEK